MKYFLLLACFIAFGKLAHCQVYPRRAPLNADFLQFRQLNQGSVLENPEELTVPPPVLPDTRKGRLHKRISPSEDLPIVYDLRPLGRMTSVKTQTTGGCWAFTTMGSIESTWLTLGAGNYDLGDRNLQICHGYHPSRNTWGNHYIATAYLARRSGPILQSQDTSTNCGWGLVPAAFVTDSRYPPDDINLVKELIMEHGAVYSMIYFSTTYYNAVNKTYYYNGPPNVNHAVDLAGWNDTLQTAGGTGAWICKNSYGPNWGDNGYFYISYNDASILIYNSFWPNRMPIVQNSTVYHFDRLGWIEDYGYGDSLCEDYGLVRFTPSENQLISRVGSHVNTGGGIVKFWIYDDFDPVSGVLSNLLNETSDMLCEYQGHYLFDLDSTLKVAAGNDFYLKVKYQTPGYPYPVPVEDTLWYQVGNTWYHDYSNPEIETGRFWMSDTGNDSSWLQLGTWPYALDLCMKAYGHRRNTDLLIRAFPEGLYDPLTGHLFKAMNGNGYQFPGDTADLVTISLHRAVAPFDLLTSFQNIPLDTSGYCHLPVPGNLASNYYIAMKHRNSVETWSSTPVSFATTGTVFFDFSNSFGSAFGNNLKPANGVFLLYSGDVNQDGLVDSSDMIIVDNDAMFFITGYLPGDLNGDGLIDSSDMIILDNNASSFVARIIPD